MDVDDPGWQFGATRAPPAARPPRRDNGREIDALILSCLSDHVYLLIPRDCAAAKRAANGNTVSLRYAPDAEHAKRFLHMDPSRRRHRLKYNLGLNFSRPVTHKAQAPIASLPPPARQALDSRPDAVARARRCRECDDDEQSITSV